MLCMKNNVYMKKVYNQGKACDFVLINVKVISIKAQIISGLQTIYK